MRKTVPALLVLLLTSVVPVCAQGSEMKAETPPDLVATYKALAEAIVGVKNAEEGLVKSILATTFSHAAATMRTAQGQISAGQPAASSLEKLAALVSQLANEGDASVAAVRKQLVEAGHHHHHHHSSAEQQDQYDPGFVIVTREAKKALAEAATAIGQLSRNPNAAELQKQWKKAEDTYNGLMKAQ